MSSSQYSSTWVFLQQFCYFSVDFVLNYSVVIKETSVDLTSFAGITNFFKVKILNPVLNVGWTSEGEDNFILCLLVSNVNWGNCYLVIDVCYFSKITELFSRLTWPGLNAFFRAIGQSRVNGIVSWLCFVVGICFGEGECKNKSD